MKKRILLLDATEKTLEQAFSEYEKKCKNKNLTDDTIKYYKDRFYLFIKYLDTIELSEKTSCNDITFEIFDNYVLWLKQKNTLKPISLKNKVKGVQPFLNYCMNSKYMNAFSFPIITYEPEQKEIYTVQELEKLLKKPSDKYSFTEWRNWAIINFILGTSCRSRTTRLLKVKNIDFENNSIIINNVKNKRPYRIPLSNALREVLETYINLREWCEDDYLFPNVYNECLSASGFSKVIRMYNRSRGVNKTSPHLLRHTFGTKWIENGGNIYELKEIMGHGSVKVTEMYLHFSKIINDEAFKSFNNNCLLNQIQSPSKKAIKIIRS